MNRLFWFLIFTGVLLLLDIYVFQAVKTVTGKKGWYWAYWSTVFFTFSGIILILAIGAENVSSVVRNFFLTWLVGVFLTKLIISLFLFIDDSQRFVRWIVSLFQKPDATSSNEINGIPRAEFLSKAGLIISSIPLITLSYGIASGAYDYRVRRQRIAFKNLPRGFDGLRIAQISDIHSGSFFNKRAVMGGVEMLLNEKPDIIFFTGDLVNNEAAEMKEYIEVFSKLKAALGVYSIMGNHDYGDYIQWPSTQAKQNNFRTLVNIQKNMGWDILLNENRTITHDGDKIALLGVENWSVKPNFPKYGDLSQAYQGIEETDFKLLLTHDPSHWRGLVLNGYKDIDITFSGHTHGFQFGIETENFRWSPVQYVYKEWAGLYREGDQYLYVNRGFGFIGFPGRIGILPEITIIELSKG
jgi:predicted MPP superfamily phosphohydrolase